MKIIKPMLIESTDKAFSSNFYVFEPKFDGIRLLLIKDNDEVNLYTRHLNKVTHKFPEIQANVANGVLLDGELICEDSESVDNFEAVMSRFILEDKLKIKTAIKEKPVKFIVFDILYYEYEKLFSKTLVERKILMSHLLNKNTDNLIPIVHIENSGEELFKLIKTHNFEGMVAKRKDSLYYPNKRTSEWLKIINWTYTDAYIYRVSYKPLTINLSKDYDGKEYLGSIQLGIKNEQFDYIKENIQKGSIPCIVKSRGWTANGKLRLPLIHKFK